VLLDGFERCIAVGAVAGEVDCREDCVGFDTKAVLVEADSFTRGLLLLKSTALCFMFRAYVLSLT
jgi:hypothetical protein